MMSGGTMYSKGDIVLVQFPFSYLVHSKKRPVIVLAECADDVIGCAITSNPFSEGIVIDSFVEGSLPFESKIKYWQINTFEKSVILQKIPTVSPKIQKELVLKIQQLIQV